MDIFPVIGKGVPNQLGELWLFLPLFFLLKSRVSDNREGEKGKSQNINEKEAASERPGYILRHHGE